VGGGSGCCVGVDGGVGDVRWFRGSAGVLLGAQVRARGGEFCAFSQLRLWGRAFMIDFFGCFLVLWG